MEISQLLVFLEVAKLKSFTGAAKSLHLSQPAISKMIRLLEEEMGVALFNRSTHHVELTDYGVAIQGQVRELVHCFRNIHVELNDVTHLKKGSICIGIPPMVGETFFPRIIGLFHQKYPQIKIKLIEVGSKKVEIGVEDGSLDVGVAVLPVKDNAFETFEFIKNPLMLIVSRQHALAARETVNLAELRDEPFVFYHRDFGLYRLIYDACLNAGFEPEVICETSQWNFMARVVAAQLGVALLPKRVCQELQKQNMNIKVIAMEPPEIYWHLALIWKKSTYVSNAAKIWINFSKTQFADITHEPDFWDQVVLS
ncbi:MAG TPA: LysR family transcriptional regulator [Patescibacteria group bacterium]|nr:LysR family transcriptional regulator [Patescibacteria group bacterium]